MGVSRAVLDVRRLYRPSAGLVRRLVYDAGLRPKSGRGADDGRRRVDQAVHAPKPSGGSRMTRNDLIKFLGATAVVALTALATPACGDSGKRATGAPGPPTTASGRPATVGVESNNKLGRILDDTRGGT